MTMTLPAGSLDEARAYFADAGLAFPEFPSDFESTIAKQGEKVWGDRPAEPGLYAIDLWADKAVAGEDFVLFGMDGHGVNSWATHLYVAKGPVAVLSQIRAGGAYMNHDQTAPRVEGAWGLSQSLFKIVAEAARQGKLPSGQRLVVVDTDFAKSRWAWVDPNSSADPAWQTSANLPPALSATADIARRMQGP